MSLVVGLEMRFVFEMNCNQNLIGVIKKRNDLSGVITLNHGYVDIFYFLF